MGYCDFLPLFWHWYFVLLLGSRSCRSTIPSLFRDRTFSMITWPPCMSAKLSQDPLGDLEAVVVSMHSNLVIAQLSVGIFFAMPRHCRHDQQSGLEGCRALLQWR